MRFLFSGIVILICLPALAQQTDINRYTLFTGFDYMMSPARNLTERGFEADYGVTLKPWLALGADFGAMGDGIISGAGTINGRETVYAPALNQSGLIPGGRRLLTWPSSRPRTLLQQVRSFILGNGRRSLFLRDLASAAFTRRRISHSHLPWSHCLLFCRFHFPKLTKVIRNYFLDSVADSMRMCRREWECVSRPTG